MGLLQQQMARLCRQLEMHRTLNSNSSNSKLLMHGRSLKEFSSGDLLHFFFSSVYQHEDNHSLCGLAVSLMTNQMCYATVVSE